MLVSACLFCLFIFYAFFQTGGLGIVAVSAALAQTAFLLIGLSMVLSSICYFWNFADTKIIYRKYLGLSGFAFALTHGIIALWFLPGVSFLDYFKQNNIMPFTFGVLALFIYSMMALISNKYAITKLGGNFWRLLLRLGYLAYAYTIIHFALRSSSQWMQWVASPRSLPPMSLLLFLFGLGVIILRLALFLSQTFFKKNSK